MGQPLVVRQVEIKPVAGLRAKGGRDAGAELIGRHEKGGKKHQEESGHRRLVPEQDPGDRRRGEHRREDDRRHWIADMPRIPSKDTDLKRAHDQLMKM